MPQLKPITASAPVGVSSINTSTLAKGQDTIHLSGSGRYKPGVFSNALELSSAAHAHLLWASGSTICHQYDIDLVAIGNPDLIDTLRKAAENSPIFPRVRPHFKIATIPHRVIGCTRYEYYFETIREKQAAAVIKIIDRYDVSISSFCLRPIPIGPNGKKLCRYGTEIHFDIKSNQNPHFNMLRTAMAAFKDKDIGFILRHWEPIREDEDGDRPWWKTARTTIGFTNHR